MPVTVKDQTYFRTAEVCRMVGITRNTLFRWFKEGVVDDVEYRDWRGWRLFSEPQVNRMKEKMTEIVVAPPRTRRVSKTVSIGK